MRTWMRVAWTTGKRELYAYALSPISYVIAALFLVVQGYSFWLLCQSLSVTRSSSSAVLAYFFGGTFLYWLFLLFVVALLTMRLFAEERQRGSLDLLLSAALPEGALVVGKFLGALGFYAALWAPTLGYVALLGRYAGQPGMLDPGPILGGYLGTLLCGLSSLSVGVLASVLAPTPLLSVALTFVSLSMLLLGGLVADLYVESPRLQAVLNHINLFQHMDELARGILDSRRLVYHLGLALAALWISARLLRTRPGDRRRLGRTAVEGAVVLALLVGVNLLAVRHPYRADLTRAGEHALSQPLRELLTRLATRGQKVEIAVLHADTGGRDELFERLRETLLRAEQVAAGQLSVEWVEMEHHHERTRLLGERYHIERDDLRQGAVVVESGGRTKQLQRLDLGDQSAEPGGEPHVTAYRGEEALGTAILTVALGRTPTVCFTRGHGEAEHDSLTGSGLSDLATAMSRDNLRTRALITPSELSAIPAACDVVAIAGPERPFLPAEVAALARYLDGGGRLLVLAGALIDRGLTRFLDTGLEELLRQRGIRLGQAVVIDPPARLGESLAFVVADTYGEHPITAGLTGRRTLWPLARPVFPLAALEPPGANQAPPQGTGHSGLSWRSRVLVSTGTDGFGETDLSGLRDHALHNDPAQDLPGPVPVAVASQPLDGSQTARIVVIGSTQLAWNDSLVLFNRDLLLGSIKWLADVPLSLAIAPRHGAELRLTLTAEQQRRLFLVLVLGLPLLALLLGGGIRWLRRSR